MAGRLALTAALVVALLPVTGAGGGGVQTPKRGGTMYIVGGTEPACLNFLIETCSNSVFQVLPATIEGAFKIGPDYSWEPRLVSGVDVTDEPFTLTYHIRPEARWNDGVPVSARDFVFTYKTSLKYPDPPDTYRAWIRSVRALGPKTVRVVLRAPFAHWRGLFSAVLPEHALRGENVEEIWVDDMNNPKTGTPIGTGPFLVEDWRRGEELTLVRNPRYWGPHPAYLQRIVTRYSVDPIEIASLFRDDKADIGQWQFNPDIVSELRQVRGLKLRFAPDPPGWEHLDIRMGRGGHPALRNTLVRRALAYGINRGAIARALFGEEIDPGIGPLDSLLDRKTSRFYEPSWSSYRYRPAEARRLLEQARCRLGSDGIYTCAGERLSFDFVARGSGRRAQTLELVRAQLRRAGVDVVPTYATQPGHDELLARGAFDVTLFAWFGPGAMHGPDSRDLYGCRGSQNYTGYCNRSVTRDLVRADRTTSARRRARVVRRADVQLAEDVPSIPLFDVPTLAAVTPEVRNFLPRFSFADPTWNAENWWLDD